MSQMASASRSSSRAGQVRAPRASRRSRSPAPTRTATRCSCSRRPTSPMRASTRELSFKVERDFTPIALVNTTAVILVVHPSTGVSEILNDLIAFAKSKPGELNYASTGIGTAPHLSGELLRAPRRNQDPACALQGQSGGGDRSARRSRQHDVLASFRRGCTGARREGSRRWAMATDKLLGILADVPTMAEAGMAGLQHLDLVRPRLRLQGTPKPGGSTNLPRPPAKRPLHPKSPKPGSLRGLSR